MVMVMMVMLVMMMVMKSWQIDTGGDANGDDEELAG